jgi:hypothetical protein
MATEAPIPEQRKFTPDEQLKLRIFLGEAISDCRMTSALRMLTAAPFLLLSDINITEGNGTKLAAMPVALAAAKMGLHHVVDLALQAGFDPETQDPLNNTLFDYAIQSGSVPLTSLLIARGAKPSADQGHELLKSTLQTFITNQPGGYELCRMLLDAGYTMNFDGRDESPLVTLARIKWEKEFAVQAPTLMACFVRAGAPVDGSPRKKIGVNPLRAAIGAKNLPAVIFLLQLQADTSTERFGRPFLEYVENSGMGAHVEVIQSAIASGIFKHALPDVYGSKPNGGASPLQTGQPVSSEVNQVADVFSELFGSPAGAEPPTDASRDASIYNRIRPTI